MTADERDKLRTEAVTNWHRRFIDLAMHVAQWSKDPSTKVGAVIVDERYKVISLGYNGFPRWVDDLEERYNDRPTKYQFVVHAELNAILNATVPLDGMTLYTTLSPCHECAKAIIQSGIIEVVYYELRPDIVTDAMFEEADIRMRTFE